MCFLEGEVGHTCKIPSRHLTWKMASLLKRPTVWRFWRCLILDHKQLNFGYKPISFNLAKQDFNSSACVSADEASFERKYLTGYFQWESMPLTRKTSAWLATLLVLPTSPKSSKPSTLSLLISYVRPARMLISPKVTTQSLSRSFIEETLCFITSKMFSLKPAWTSILCSHFRRDETEGKVNILELCW